MEDIDWITVVTQLEQQLLTAIVTLRDLRQDIEYRRSTRPAPEQLVMTSEYPVHTHRNRRHLSEAPQARRAWSQADIDRLVMLWLSNVPTADIATQLGRSVDGVCRMTQELRASGVAIPKRNGTGKVVR